MASIAVVFLCHSVTGVGDHGDLTQLVIRTAVEELRLVSVNVTALPRLQMVSSVREAELKANHAIHK